MHTSSLVPWVLHCLVVSVKSGKIGGKIVLTIFPPNIHPNIQQKQIANIPRSVIKIMDLGIFARLHSWQVLVDDVTTHNSYMYRLLFAENIYKLVWDACVI